MRTWALETAIEHIPGGAVVTVKGRVGQPTAGQFGEALALARRDTSRLIVDLQGVDYVSGPGLAALAETAEAVDTLILCGVAEAVRNTLELAGLTDRVGLEETREAALGRLQQTTG